MTKFYLKRLPSKICTPPPHMYQILSQSVQNTTLLRAPSCKVTSSSKNFINKFDSNYHDTHHHIAHLIPSKNYRTIKIQIRSNPQVEMHSSLTHILLRFPHSPRTFPSQIAIAIFASVPICRFASTTYTHTYI